MSRLSVEAVILHTDLPIQSGEGGNPVWMTVFVFSAIQLPTT